MAHHPQEIQASEFKAKCLHLMDEVQETKEAIVITKHGVPVAKLVPIKAKPVNLFGCLRGSVTINKDIIKPIDIKWDADAK